MLLYQSLKEMEDGHLLRLQATDPTTRRDVRDFCHHLGHQLLTTEEKDGVLSYIIRKKSTRRSNQGASTKSMGKGSPEENKGTEQEKLAKAIFAAGCFWHIQDMFHNMDGVQKALAGYTGGTTENPSYEEVCTGNGGHAEAVLVEYDPQRLPYTQLLKAFWQCHDPTQLNRQGADIGSQYRSAIFYCSAEQRKVAEKSKAQLEARHKYGAPIVTQIAPATPFYPAEEYHQMYLQKKKHS